MTKMQSNRVAISDTPHLRHPRTVRGIMLDVLISLLPASIAGVVFFGGRAAFMLALTVSVCFLTEFVWLLAKRQSPRAFFAQFDFTSLVTGVLLALTMPPLDYRYCYVPILASVFAIAVAKMAFGGTGRNIINPAIGGRVFAFIAFMSLMTSGYAVPRYSASVGSEYLSGATPLTRLLGDGVSSVGLSNLDLFLGVGVRGCIGETCKLALLLGALYLIVRRVIRPLHPVVCVVVAGLVGVFMSNFDFGAFLPSVLGGGLILGAFFMATDYVTSPSVPLASFVYFALLGAVIALLRVGTGIETVSFAILLMNLIVPLLDEWLRPRPFGAKPVRLVLRDAILALGKKPRAASSPVPPAAVENPTSPKSGKIESADSSVGLTKEGNPADAPSRDGESTASNAARPSSESGATIRSNNAESADSSADRSASEENVAKRPEGARPGAEGDVR